MTKINQGIKELVRIFPEGGRKAYLRLDMNENPEGIPKDFVEEVKEQITPEFLATYPEPQEMTAALAEYHHISEDCFALSDGSEMAIKHVFEVFAVPGSNVVTVTPSFAMYGVFCSMYGVEHRAVAIGEDFRFPDHRNRMAQVVQGLHAVYVHAHALLPEEGRQFRVAFAVLVPRYVKGHHPHPAETFQGLIDRRPGLVAHVLSHTPPQTKNASCVITQLASWIN